MRIFPSSSLFRSCSGQSLIELLIAMAIGTIMVIAAGTLIAPALKSHQSVSRIQIAAALGKELFDNARIFAETDWHNVENLTTGGTAYFIDGHGAYIRVVTGTESVVVDNVTGTIVAHWKFDESVGSTTFDTGGNQYDGTIMDAATRTSASWVGTGLLLDGVTSRMQTATSGPFEYRGGNMTVVLWARPDTGESDGGDIISKPWNSSGHYNWRLIFNAAKTLTAYVKGSSTVSSNTTTATTTLGTWMHLAIVLGSDNTVRLYKDGVLIGNWTHAIGDWASANDGDINLCVGSLYPYASGWGGNSTYSFNGILDDVRIYNKALTEAEIKKIYSAAIFTRSFAVSTVCRDTVGAIGSCGTSDPSTRQITVSFGPVGLTPSTMASYLTRGRNYVFSQTDWSGGGGFSGPYTTTTNRYANATSTNATSTPGSIVINGI